MNSWFDETYGKGEYYFDVTIEDAIFDVELHMIVHSDENDNSGECQVEELIIN